MEAREFAIRNKITSFWEYNQREANPVREASTTSRWAVLHDGEDSTTSVVWHTSCEAKVTNSAPATTVRATQVSLLLMLSSSSQTTT